MTITLKRKWREASDDPGVDVVQPVTGPAGVFGAPELVLLTSDACSSAARRLHRFADPEAAAGFVRFWYAPEHRSGIIACWSLTREPANAPAEALVLIRDARDHELVYPFSFICLEDAMRFLRTEMARGLHLGLVAVYYAVTVTIGSTRNGDAFVWPAEPPATAPVDTPYLGTETPVFAAVATPAISVQPSILPDDLVDRVLCVLRIQRWEGLPDPFQGFGSPPGRF